MKLADILQDTPVKNVRGPVDRTIQALRYDSRKVEADDVFFAWHGAKTDGHRYIADVSDRGAAAVVLEDGGCEVAGPTLIEVPDARRAMATMSANYFGRPDRSLQMVGVTGTNGKTTTTELINAVLTAGGKRTLAAGNIGTAFSAAVRDSATG